MNLKIYDRVSIYDIDVECQCKMLPSGDSRMICTNIPRRCTGRIINTPEYRKGLAEIKFDGGKIGDVHVKQCRKLKGKQKLLFKKEETVSVCYLGRVTYAQVRDHRFDKEKNIIFYLLQAKIKNGDAFEIAEFDQADIQKFQP